MCVSSSASSSCASLSERITELTRRQLILSSNQSSLVGKDPFLGHTYIQMHTHSDMLPVQKQTSHLVFVWNSSQRVCVCACVCVLWQISETGYPHVCVSEWAKVRGETEHYRRTVYLRQYQHRQSILESLTIWHLTPMHTHWHVGRCVCVYQDYTVMRPVMFDPAHP